MRIIAVDIRGARANIIALEKVNNEIKDITGTFTSLSLQDHKIAANVQSFQKVLFEFFQTISPQKIAILEKSSSGTFAASPISFKVEGIIQCYSVAEIVIVSPNTIAAFYNKNDVQIIYGKFSYQKEAARLGTYIIKKYE